MNRHYAYFDPEDAIPQATIRDLQGSSDDTLLTHLLSAMAQPPEFALDAGAGAGRLSATLCAHADRVLLLDPDAARLRRARRVTPKADVWCGRIQEYGAAYSSVFDFILIAHVIQHTPTAHRLAIAHAVHSLLRPTGIALWLFTCREAGSPSHLISKETSHGHETVVSSRIEFDNAALNPSIGRLPVWHASQSELHELFQEAGLDCAVFERYRTFSYDIHSPHRQLRAAEHYAITHRGSM